MRLRPVLQVGVLYLVAVPFVLTLYFGVGCDGEVTRVAFLKIFYLMSSTQDVIRVDSSRQQCGNSLTDLGVDIKLLLLGILFYCIRVPRAAGLEQGKSPIGIRDDLEQLWDISPVIRVSGIIIEDFPLLSDYLSVPPLRRTTQKPSATSEQKLEQTTTRRVNTKVVRERCVYFHIFFRVSHQPNAGDSCYPPEWLTARKDQAV
ncbi:uncharacterized protein CLUP02_11883 [Colletotrichum lupini]|uniref:Uncharacterized protein n=1 Tax=Colletotrichum lupini TaxID=145971 RepID=A0A9Q8SZH7_9PEZI|nr:uncharacterized protein CLUP02_11883 [Colletotrichum lupini]UQC86383.1 hypothetical protein CLUP02_11883 [Colletotrichum lupini]